MSDFLTVVLFLFFVACSITIYFLPTIICCYRNHRQSVPIFILNMFLGWSLIGWVIALVWSVMEYETPRANHYRRN